jgi:glycosyltransferase involved in cell wall biosynthesis
MRRQGIPVRPAGRSGRIGLTSVEEELPPEGWSGIPAGLARGLRYHGFEPVPASSQLWGPLRLVALGPSALVRRSRVDAYFTPEQEALRGFLARRRLRRRGALHDVVLLGAELSLPPSTRYVSLMDLTLAQAHVVHPVFRRLSPRVAASANARQGRVYAAARACCPASHWTARSLQADYGVAGEKIHVVGLGRNHEPPARAGDWRVPRFLFIGVDWERKNGPLLLETFAHLRRERPDARLDLVGGHPRLDQPGVCGHGLLKLDRDDDRERVAHLLARATCFVMPSEAEPFGIAYTEAAAAGVPSIATTVGGAETILGEDGGLLVEPGDRHALAAAMERLADGDVARSMGEAARRRAELFTWEAVAGRVLRAIEPPGLDPSGLPPFL